jgi:hypothetical protein
MASISQVQASPPVYCDFVKNLPVALFTQLSTFFSPEEFTEIIPLVSQIWRKHTLYIPAIQNQLNVCFEQQFRVSAIELVGLALQNKKIASNPKRTFSLFQDDQDEVLQSMKMRLTYCIGKRWKIEVFKGIIEERLIPKLNDVEQNAEQGSCFWAAQIALLQKNNDVFSKATKDFVAELQVEKAKNLSLQHLAFIHKQLRANLEKPAPSKKESVSIEKEDAPASSQLSSYEGSSSDPELFSVHSSLQGLIPSSKEEAENSDIDEDTCSVEEDYRSVNSDDEDGLVLLFEEDAAPTSGFKKET